MNLKLSQAQTLDLLSNLIASEHQLEPALHPLVPGGKWGKASMALTFDCGNLTSTPLPLPEITLKADGTWEAVLSVDVG